MQRPVSALPWLWLVASCAATSAPTPPPASAPSVEEAELPLPAFPRKLGPDARFADLVRSVGALAATDGTSSSRRCLLGKSGNGLAFEAELAPAVQPLPAPSNDLDAVLTDATSVNILTPFGRYGHGESPLTLASLTYTPPTRRAAALFITDAGIRLRSARPAARAPAVVADGLTAAEAPLVLRDLEETTVYVAAEAQIPLSQVWRLLKELRGHTTHVALALNLLPGTTLPPRKDAAEAPPRCPDGLGPATGPRGDLAPARVRAALAPLVEQAPECLTRAEGPGAAGGRLSLALRVDETGRVARACIRGDETNDAALERCVLSLAERLAFPAPTPAGSVDIALPLVLKGRHAPPQEVICRGSDE